MKKIVAYVSTLRVHWLVEELGKLGIREMVVTEYFRPLSRISRFEFICRDVQLQAVFQVIHRIGSSGTPGDHFINAQDVEPGMPQSVFSEHATAIMVQGG